MKCPWSLQSRVHRLNQFPESEGQCYVKRDDELSCGISGSKIRKYASLIPHWYESGANHLVVIGGAQSNNVLACAQIAREQGWRLSLFLLKPWNLPKHGNFNLTQLFVSPDDIHWIERDNWQRVIDAAQDYIDNCDDNCFLVTEGASVNEAMAGAMSLAVDIKRNEQELAVSFNHIFIDAGTGFSAIALIKAMNDSKHQSCIHVLLLADDMTVFTNKVKHLLTENPNNYQAFKPSTAKSFGAVNATIKQSIQRMAMEEGILVDPVYSAKLFFEARLKIEQKNLTGNTLIIHSGGVLSLPNILT